ncbi:MAG: DUF393 domain-containing protein [Rhodobacteraceae bacterium]|nr:MAG: DUF393 domain-containing protein [Paracoccaceae bacterium]
MISVYFDGKCSLCKREISYYKTIAPANKFLWKDIASDPSHLQEINVSQQAALRRLHVLDDEKKLIIGFDAFIVIWSQIKLWHLVALIGSLPIINLILKQSYNFFADWKFRRSPHCSLSNNPKILKDN